MHFCGNPIHDFPMFAIWLLSEGRDVAIMIWRFVVSLVSRKANSSEDEALKKIREMATYAVVDSVKLDAFVGSHGSVGGALETFSSLAEAREYAEQVAPDYDYGVEIVDMDEWGGVVS